MPLPSRARRFLLRVFASTPIRQPIHQSKRAGCHSGLFTTRATRAPVAASVDPPAPSVSASVAETAHAQAANMQTEAPDHFCRA